MSDVIDQACDYEQHDREVCIAAARQQAKLRELIPGGRCYNCDEPVALDAVFCPGSDCRDDHTKREQAAKRKGRSQ